MIEDMQLFSICTIQASKANGPDSVLLSCSLKQESAPVGAVAWRCPRHHWRTFATGQAAGSFEDTKTRYAWKTDVRLKSTEALIADLLIGLELRRLVLTDEQTGTWILTSISDIGKRLASGSADKTLVHRHTAPRTKFLLSLAISVAHLDARENGFQQVNRTERSYWRSRPAEMGSDESRKASYCFYRLNCPLLGYSTRQSDASCPDFGPEYQYVDITGWQVCRDR